MPDAVIDDHHEKLARKALEEDVHYLGSLEQLASSQAVVVREAVFAANGIKLIDQGVAIDSGLRQRLVHHRLLKPIDQNLEVKDGIDGEVLAQATVLLAQNSPLLQQVVDCDAELAATTAAMRALQLPAQLAVKLAVMRSRMAWLFDHVLVAALISHCLAQRLRLPAAAAQEALLAGLTHDLGELHTDPSLLDRRHKMDDHELCHIDVHPITGYLIAKELWPQHPAVAAAVLQHHEKLDGSGYPNRLRGDAIGVLPRILSIADACASIIVRSANGERLSAWIRLSRQKHDRAMLELLQRKRLPQDAAQEQEPFLDTAETEATAQLLLRWTEFSAAMRANPPAATVFLFERMADLRVILLQFGLDPDRPDLLHALAAEPEIGRELEAAFDEVRRQITDIQRETQRRREALAKTLSFSEVSLLDGWLAEIRRYLGVVGTIVRIPAEERRRGQSAQ